MLQKLMYVITCNWQRYVSKALKNMKNVRKSNNILHGT